MALEDALRVPQTIRDANAGRPMNRVLLAEAMAVSPNSSSLRSAISSSSRYGLTEGSYSSESIALTELGSALTSPRDETERTKALRESVRNVPIFDQLLRHFANNKLPSGEFLKNTLQREPFNVEAEWSEEVATNFARNARFVGFLRPLKDSDYVVIDASDASPNGSPIPAEDNGGPHVGSVGEPPPATPTELPPATLPAEAPTAAQPMQIFIGHGKNRKALDQLKQILNEWQVPFLVAVDEPNAGRPISKKVAETMQECSAGIFIFTADEELVDKNGETIHRPSQNVIFELGAASLLYGRKIVIFKEADVNFPTDFSDLGWIEFEKDNLTATAMELLREMVQLKAVRLVSPVAS